MDIVKFAEAAAWPIALMFASLMLYFTVKLVVSKGRSLNVNVKDWLKFETDASREIVDTTQKGGNAALVDASNIEQNQSIGSPEEDPNEFDVKEEVDPSARTTPGEDGISIFFNAKNLDDLQYGFEQFRKDDAERDWEFWSTYYVERKRALGAQNTEADLEKLLTDNNEWTSPYGALLRFAVEAHDIQKVEIIKAQAFRRRSASSFPNVLHWLIHAYFKLMSPSAALGFYRETVRSNATNIERSAMLSSLAQQFKNAGDDFQYQILTEMTLLVSGSDQNRRFQLAYSYGDNSSAWALSFAQYSKLSADDEQYQWAMNNLGVSLRSFDKDVSLEFYSKARSSGSALATSNLARLLIDDGYVEIGEGLLDEIIDQSSAEEHIASTRAAAFAKKRQRQKCYAEISNVASLQADQFRSVVAQTQRHMDAGGAFPLGVFSTIDSSLSVFVDGAGAACKFVVGTITLSGILQNSLLGFDGVLTENSTSILSGSHLRITLFAVSGNRLVAVNWPKWQALNERYSFSELHRVEGGANTSLPSGQALLG